MPSTSPSSTTVRSAYDDSRGRERFAVSPGKGPGLTWLHQPNNLSTQSRSSAGSRRLLSGAPLFSFSDAYSAEGYLLDIGGGPGRHGNAPGDVDQPAAANLIGRAVSR